MRNNYQSIIPLCLGCLVCVLFLSSKANACGYNWVSDCSSQVQLRINGTLDSFLIAPCPSGFNFDGLSLGAVQSISLANAKTITWESCQNNVSGMKLFYRIYEQDQPGNSWLSLNLQDDHVTIDGAYTTRYKKIPQETPLNAGLIPGKTYTLEIYLLAEIDTIGDDNIPETTLRRDNNGQNYKMTFTYGGAAAAPLLLLPHLTQPSCYAGNNGKISISVYGDHTGIFYHWSNTPSNFFEQNFIPAGNYGITVTNAAGAVTTASIELDQPSPLVIEFQSIQSIGCNQNPGFASVSASGGSGGYQFFWSNGQTSPQATFANGGIYTVTATDAHNCTQTATTEIGYDGLVNLFQSSSICQGESLVIGAQTFTTAGAYEVLLPGSNACDTLLNLNLSVHPHLPATISGTIHVTCHAVAGVWLHAHSPAVQPNFSWMFQGMELSNSDSCYFTIPLPPPSPLDLPNLVVVDEFGCLNAPVETDIQYLADNQSPSIAIDATHASNALASDGAANATVFGSSGPFTFLWNTGDTSGSITDLAPGIYCVTVTAANACSTSGCVEVSFNSKLDVPQNIPANAFPNPVCAGNVFCIQLPPESKGHTFELSVMDGFGHLLFKRYDLQPDLDKKLNIRLPESLAAGLISWRLNDATSRFQGKICVLGR
ncbi:MAG: hypothetical protein JNJ57_20960 [Saprospiraceae bacterium]|nr:hypothetical protein [Saprospiraceae bacterium]